MRPEQTLPYYSLLSQGTLGRVTTLHHLNWAKPRNTTATRSIGVIPWPAHSLDTMTPRGIGIGYVACAQGTLPRHSDPA